MRKNKGTLYIFSHNVEPNGISGGETILIETFKRIRTSFKSIIVYTWKPGRDLYTKYGLTNVTYKLSKLPVVPNFYLSFLLRTVYGIYLGFSLEIKNSPNAYLYFSSDFWPDSLPVVMLKLRYPKAKFISNFYLAAPNPFYGFNEQKKFHMPSINGIFFYLMQQPIYWFSIRFANLIFVTSEPDVDRFPKQKAKDNYFVVKGGVNVLEIERFKKTHRLTHKVYDGVFMGRFHPQKGVLELIDIWKVIVKTNPLAKLVMIGDGALMEEVKERIRKYALQNNVTLTGYIFTTEKRYTIFQQSKIALHPATYDSGGMAVAEAMAFGLPAVSFDLVALKTYYPKGMLKVKKGDIKGFARTVVELLGNKKLYQQIKEDAYDLVVKDWNWDIRAKEIGQKILSV